MESASAAAAPAMVAGPAGSFVVDGRRLAYETFGTGERHLVFVHALLLDSNLNRGLARRLAAAGFHVVLLDLLGHGRSEKPQHAAEYRTDVYARQVVGLLDHLGIDEAVLGGISLGANVTLLVAARWPERVRGLLVEMPVLEGAVPAAAMTFVPLLLSLRYTSRLAHAVARIVRRVPRTETPIDSLLNVMSNDPGVTTAILHGLLIGPVAPTIDERMATTAPALVLGHRWDLIHPLDDADKLAQQLPNARLVSAHGPLELRVRPKRLLGEIEAFLAAVWQTVDLGVVRDIAPTPNASEPNSTQ
jgi:pimeloyl-ACP methyl ester carboxylesterase